MDFLKHALGFIRRAGIGRAIRDVQAYPVDAASLLPLVEVLKRLIDLIVADIREHDVHSRIDESLCRTEADAARAAGYERHFAFYVVHRDRPPSPKASEGILLRNPRRGKSCEARSAKQDGGRTRTRTWDPLIKSQLLYQLSYAPVP